VIDILDVTGSIRQYNLTTGAFLGTLASNIAGSPTGIALRRIARNVTAQVQITRSAYRFNASTQTYVQRVTIKNLTGTAIVGPISLALDNLGSNATLIATNGTTSLVGLSGSPYINFVLSGTSLGPGATATVSLNFVDPSNTLIAYVPRILAGVGSR
jgi:hypothetical protein